jgi:hypothetical protein
VTEPAKTAPVSPGTLRVQGSSRAALGATTVALISLASGGTAMLVAHGTRDLTTPTSLPGGLLSEIPNLSGPVVVARAPGTTPAAAPAPAPDPTELALREALTRRLPPAGPRTLLVPLVDLGSSGLTGGVPRVPPVAAPAVPPVTRPVTAPVPPTPPTTPPTNPPTNQPASQPTPPSTVPVAPPAVAPAPHDPPPTTAGDDGNDHQNGHTGLARGHAAHDPQGPVPRGRGAERAQGHKHARPFALPKHAR